MCFSKLCKSFTCIISPSSSMALYQATCPCVCAQACSGECQPGKGLSGATYLPICVATTSPILPLRNSGSDTVPFPRSGRSVSPFSRAFISETGLRRSRFHSRAFILRSMWASMVNIGCVLVVIVVLVVMVADVELITINKTTIQLFQQLQLLQLNIYLTVP